MKTINLIIALLFITSISCAQKSPRKQSDGKIGGVNISIDYGSPYVKNRVIWGKLVKYDKVWRAGANENTIISFDKDVTINGNKLPAGKYGLFMIPKENGDWTVIFNSKSDAWGHFSYKDKEDVLRVHIKPEFVSKNQESLSYTVNEKTIDFSWEKTRLSIPVSVK